MCDIASRTNSRAPSTSPAPLTADGKGKRRIAGDDSSPDLRKSSNESTNNNSARKHSDQGSVENLELLSPRPPPPVPSHYKDRYNFGEQRMAGNMMQVKIESGHLRSKLFFRIRL